MILQELRQIIYEVVVEEVLANELKFIRSFVLKHNDVFEAAYIVGSWAKQAKSRMPDRAGLNSSDIDLIIIPYQRSIDMWDLATEFEREWSSLFVRKLHLNLDEVIGDASKIRIV